jgi:nucleoside-diphosphate-sugar epimerase
VVILGASGFVGRRLAERLQALQVGTALFSTPSLDLVQPASVDYLRGVLRPDDVLVFCSALTPDRGRDPATMMKNLRMAEHVGAALEQARCAHVVYVSSDAVYEESPNPVRDDTPPAPSSLYGLMHLVREKVMAAATASARLPLLILRPCAIYGAGDTHNSYGPNRFIRTARSEGRIQLFGGGEEQRHHLYIDDFVAVLEEGLCRRSQGVLTVAGAEAATFREVAEVLARLLDPAPRLESRPRGGGPAGITHRHYDLTAMVKALPWVALTPLEVGLRRTLSEWPA